MALPVRLAEALKRERMPHVTFRHPPTYTALELAAVSQHGRVVPVYNSFPASQPYLAALERQTDPHSLLARVR